MSGELGLDFLQSFTHAQLSRRFSAQTQQAATNPSQDAGEWGCSIKRQDVKYSICCRGHMFWFPAHLSQRLPLLTTFLLVSSTFMIPLFLWIYLDRFFCFCCAINNLLSVNPACDLPLCSHISRLSVCFIQGAGQRSSTETQEALTWPLALTHVASMDNVQCMSESSFRYNTTSEDRILMLNWFLQSHRAHAPFFQFYRDSLRYAKHFPSLEEELGQWVRVGLGSKD